MPGARIAGALASLALVASAAVALAQTAQTEAGAFAGGQAGNLTIGATPSAETVPGYGGEAPTLQTFEGNPNGMTAAGETAAIIGSDQFSIAKSGNQAAAANAIDTNSAWLKQSLDAHQNPMTLAGEGGGVTGTEGQECKPQEETTTTTTKDLYTCESVLEVSNSSATCTRSYQPKVETYSYVCTETYSGGSWNKSPSCTVAGTDPNCTNSGRVCTQPTAPTYSAYECRVGYNTSSGSHTCTSGTVYSGSFASCENVTQTHTSYTTGGCGNSLNVQVTETEGPPVVSEFECWDNDWNYGACYAQYNQCLVEQQACFGDGQGGTQCVYRVVCQSAGPKTVQEHDSWSNSCSLPSNCAATRTYCADSGVKQIGGYSVYRDCWYWATEYQCANTTTYTDTSQCQALRNQGCSFQSSSGNTETYACFSATSVNTCGSLSGNCSLQGQSCAAESPWGGCSAWQQTYTCSETTPVNTCAPPAGAQHVSDTCEAYNGQTCSMTLRRYQVQNPDPTNGCQQYTTNYSCGKDTGGTWTYDQACPQAADATCTGTGRTCISGPATRVVGGFNVYSDCWQDQETYTCESYNKKSNCQPAANCQKIEDNCLDDAADGVCRATDHVYECTNTKTVSTTVTKCTNKMCLGDSCFEMSRDANGELGQTYAQLATMQTAGRDYAAELSIMKGTKLRCRKAVVGFMNCCKDSGWGLDIGLASCDAQEQQLMDKQGKKATHYVGTYCSNKSFFGLCLQKSMVYCGFEGTLGRIIQEAGRPQIGKGWGTPDKPDCSGFTVDQFQQLDLSNVDFSDFYSEKMSQLAGPDSGSTVSNIQNSIQNLYNNQIPGAGNP